VPSTLSGQGGNYLMNFGTWKYDWTIVKKLFWVVELLYRGCAEIKKWISPNNTYYLEIDIQFIVLTFRC